MDNKVHGVLLFHRSMLFLWFVSLKTKCYEKLKCQETSFILKL